MPVRDSLQKPLLPGEAELRSALKEELEKPQDSGEPEIIIDRPSSFTIHLYVIWSKWEGLDQVVRSRAILDVFTEVKGAEDARKVTIAMGLTPEEAKRLGMA